MKVGKIVAILAIIHFECLDTNIYFPKLQEVKKNRPEI